MQGIEDRMVKSFNSTINEYMKSMLTKANKLKDKIDQNKENLKKMKKNTKEYRKDSEQQIKTTFD